MTTPDHASAGPKPEPKAQSRATTDGSTASVNAPGDIVGLLQHLQRTAGNNAVNQLLHRYAFQRAGPPASHGSGAPTVPQTSGADTLVQYQSSVPPTACIAIQRDNVAGEADSATSSTSAGSSASEPTYTLASEPTYTPVQSDASLTAMSPDPGGSAPMAAGILTPVAGSPTASPPFGPPDGPIEWTPGSPFNPVRDPAGDGIIDGAAQEGAGESAAETMVEDVVETIGQGARAGAVETLEEGAVAVGGSTLAATGAGLLAFLWPRSTAPAWMDELNPITHAPYRSEEEYRQIHHRLRQRQSALPNTAPDPVQLPAGQDAPPVSEPTTPEPLYTPADQDQSPIADPARSNEPVTLPGQHGVEPLQAAPSTSLIAQTIASGHAFSKHVVNRGEFPEITGNGTAAQSRFAQIIDQVMQSTDNRSLIDGRHAYWDDSTGTIVITDPNSSDGGTCFRPATGKSYYDNLR